MKIKEPCEECGQELPLSETGFLPLVCEGCYRSAQVSAEVIRRAREFLKTQEQKAPVMIQGSK